MEREKIKSRIVKKLIDNEWKAIPFSELRINDIFIIFDDGERISDKNGNDEFKVTSNPKYSELYRNILSVDVEPIQRNINEFKKTDNN